MAENTPQNQIKHTLTQLGMNESDITIYMLGLEIGAATIAQLAQESDMWRVTVHEIVRRLIWYGVFLESRSGRRRLVYPNTVDAIHHMLDARKLALTQLESQVTHTAQLLRDIQAQSQNFPKTRYYKGQEGIRLMMSEIIKDGQNVSIISDGQHFYELIDNELLEKSLKMRKENNLTISMIFPRWFEYFTFTQGIYQQQLNIKFLPEDTILHGGMTIRWDKVAIHCYEWRYITTTIIENSAIAQMMRFYYDQTWKAN